MPVINLGSLPVESNKKQKDIERCVIKKEFFDKDKQPASLFGAAKSIDFS